MKNFQVDHFVDKATANKQQKITHSTNCKRVLSTEVREVTQT